uniref:Phosphoglycolate phosphatase n=1 Tax=Panagrolaimus sp. ES5 TaxID=591445 RepID=A0AC34F7Y1_9BILA
MTFSTTPTVVEPLRVTSLTFPQLLKEIDTFIFDADGVLWLGEDRIEGSPEFLDYLLRMNKRVIVLTNNATKSRAVYAKKLANLGYNERINKTNIVNPAALANLGYNERINKTNIVNPAAVVADTLYRTGIKQLQKKVYLIGSQGIKDELDNLGIEYFGDGPDPIENQPDNRAFIYDLQLEEKPEEVGAVVVGYEKHFNYHKLMKAANYLQDEDCLFIATNADETCPAANYLQDEDCLFIATNADETCPGPNPNVIIPDAGPILAAVQTAANREALVVGKPNTPAYDYICRRWKINPSKTIMIGDRTNTDVKFGRDHGLRTMLVLSGCHQVEDILENQINEREDMIPDFYADCLGALIPQRCKE